MKRNRGIQVRGIIFLCEVICKIIKYRLVQCLDKKEHCVGDRLALLLTEIAWKLLDLHKKKMGVQLI